MINTLNESHLHKSLKTYYSAQDENSRTETAVGDYIADIVCGNEIIEIQTGNLSHLLKKILYFMEEKYTVRVVYPLVTCKIIETFDKNGKISHRKSPVKKSMYSIFKELTGLTPVLYKLGFFLDVIEVTVIEKRLKSEELIQSQNKKRRFKKNWIKTDKELSEMGKITTFHGKSSYRKLLPKNLPPEFTRKDVLDGLLSEGTKVKPNEIALMMWVFSHSNLVEIQGKKGNSYLYKIGTN